MDEDIPPIPEDFFSKASVEIALISACSLPISASLELELCPLSSPSCPGSPLQEAICPENDCPDPLKRLPKRKQSKCPLSHFTRKAGRPPKTEYFIAMLVRGLKKAIKRAEEGGQGPCCGLFEVLGNSGKWQRFQRQVEPLLRYIDTASLGSRSTKGSISFSKQCLRSFYDSPYVRIAHFYFIDLVFSASPDLLVAALKIQCCEGIHSEACERLWGRLRDYATWWMLKEVGLDPFREI